MLGALAVLIAAGAAPSVPRTEFAFRASFTNFVAQLNIRLNGMQKRAPQISRDLFRSKKHEAFASAKAKLAVIVAGAKAATGFLVREGGRTWLVTNAHVVRDQPIVRATLLDGTTLALGRCQFAAGRDLARFVVGGTRPGLEIRSGLPDVGERISILGNTDGRGVVTEINGSIVGVGPTELEVDAPFTTGNSGSPVLDRNGRLLAVASYLRDCRNDKDWSKKNTRFNGIRRFCLRLSGVRWE